MVQAVGLELRDLFGDCQRSVSLTRPITRVCVARARRRPERAGTPQRGIIPGLPVVRNEITLAEYAEAKALPIGFLSGLGLRDRRRDGKAAVVIPYLSPDGEVIAIRYRIAMAGDRFRWRERRQNATLRPAGGRGRKEGQSRPDRRR